MTGTEYILGVTDSVTELPNLRWKIEVFPFKREIDFKKERKK